jgi:hypothetical protein
MRSETVTVDDLQRMTETLERIVVQLNQMAEDGAVEDETEIEGEFGS